MIYQIQDLTFSYPSSDIILDNVSFVINERGSYTILGRNGAGKTTLLKCMLNELTNYKGKIKLSDKNIQTLKEKEIAKLVSYVPQSSDCTFDYTVFEYVLMGTASNISLFSSPGKKEEELVNIALEKLMIEEFKNRKFNELSGGEKQKVTIARAIVNNPKVILFDEPCSHLDYKGQLQILSIIKELVDSGFSAVLTTHDPNHALMLNDKVLLFKNKGKIELGETKNIITERNLKQVYGIDIKIRYLEEFKRDYIVYPSLHNKRSKR